MNTPIYEATSRSKAYYLRKLGEAGIDDLEDAYMGAAVLERVRSGQEQTYSLNEVMAELGLNASDHRLLLKVEDPKQRGKEPDSQPHGPLALPRG